MDEESKAVESKPKKRGKVIMLGVLAGVMLAEAAGVFVLIKHFSKSAGPSEAEAATAPTSQPAHGEEPGGLVASEGKKAEPEIEIKIGEFRAQNRKGQRSYMLSFTVFASLPAAAEVKQEEGKAKKEEGGEGGEGEGAKAEAPKARPEEAVVATRSAKIKDRFSRAIRAMDPEQFMEPELMSLRSKLKSELREVMGPDFKIQEVLITDFSCQPEN